MSNHIEDEKSLNSRSFSTMIKVFHALIELTKTKNIETITVKAITTQANISRGTFYLYFSDIEQVIQTIEKFLLDKMPRIAEYCNLSEPRSFPDFPSLEDCTNNAWEEAWFLYFQTYQEPLNTLLGPHGDGSFYLKLKKAIMKELNQHMLFDGFTNDAMSKYFQSLYADTFLILAQEWTQKKYNDNLDVQSLSSIAATIRIGSQYSYAIMKKPLIHEKKTDDE